MPAGDVYESSIDMTFAGQKLTNVIHFVQVGADGTGDPRESVTGILTTDFLPDYQNLVVDSLTFDQVQARRLFPTQTQQWTAASGVVGTQLSDGLPPQSCAILRLYGSRIGNRYVGRQLISGLPTSAVKDGQINNTLMGLLGIYGDHFESSHSFPISGYEFTATILRRADSTNSQIIRAQSLARVRTARSRQLGIGQ